VDNSSDLYRTLGVAPGASDAEIRSAFRRLARQYHPDVNPDPAAPERFRAVVAAYEVLSDAPRRASYDQQRTGRRPTWNVPGAGGSWRTGSRRATTPGVSTMPPVPGMDRHSTLRVASSVLQRGGTGTLSHRRWEHCERCGGFGRLQEEVPCTACGGAGFHGGYLSDPCKVCWTTGTTTICPECRGKGGLWRAKRVDVTIPAGARYGQQLRLRGMGDAGPRGGPPGDLYVELSPPLPAAVRAVASHELLQAALRRLEEWLDRFAPYPVK
jgi:molecular chaperone DnaJ